jgi:hypothetical protein
VSLVRNLFLVYFSVLALLMIVGFVTRRSALAWGIAAVYAVVATAFVLQLAKSRGEFDGKLLAAVEIDPNPDGMSRPFQAFYCIYSDANVRLDVAAPDETSLLSAIPPTNYSMMPFALQSASSFGGGGGGFGASSQGRGNEMQIVETYEIQRRNGVALLADLNIRALATKQFSLSSSLSGAVSAAGTVVPSISRPVVSYSGTGISLEPWSVPAERNPESAFLLYAGGVLALDLADQTVRLSTRPRDTFTSDRIFRTLQTAMTEGFPKMTPSLVLVEPISDPILPLPEDTALQGRRLYLYGVRERCESDSVLISPEQIVFVAGDTSTRMIMNGNRFRKGFEIQGVTSCLFRFQLPPLFSGLVPDEIQVEFSYLNPGGNITVVPHIQLGDKKISGVLSAPGVYVFRDPAMSAALDPLNGSGTLVLDANEKNASLDPAQKLRANQWEMSKLRISVKGTPSVPVAPFVF